MRSWLVPYLVPYLFLVTACGDDSSDLDAGRDASLVDVGLSDSPFDARDATAMPCDAPGAMRTAACGNCGTGQEICQDGVWMLTACVGEGECAPGSLEVLDAPMCQEITRVCQDDCSWLEEESRPAGECEPGTARFDATLCDETEHRPETCNSTCTWEASAPCESICGELRTAPTLESEVCVPAGDFIRGDDLPGLGGAPTPTPSALVTLSYAFAVDSYPVTYERYARCVDAGGCVLDPDLESTLANPTFNLRGALLQRSEILEFCQWDGGRRMLTEAEFEKALRGPAPRRGRWPFGDAWDCDLLPGPECGEIDDNRDIGTESGSVTYYGVRDWDLDVFWVSDFWDPDAYADPSTRLDPQGPPDGTMGTTHLPFTAISRRSGTDPRARFLALCARTIEGV